MSAPAYLIASQDAGSGQLRYRRPHRWGSVWTASPRTAERFATRADAQATLAAIACEREPDHRLLIVQEAQA